MDAHRSFALASTVLTNPEVVKLIDENFISFGWDMSTDAARNFLFNATRGFMKLSREITANYPELLCTFVVVGG